MDKFVKKLKPLCKNEFLKKWWLVILLSIILAGGVLVFLRGDEDEWTKNKYGIWVKHGNPSSAAPDGAKTAETWKRDKTMLMGETTSSDTHKISDNLYRMFVNGKGGISYAESTDGKNWGSLANTGVTEDENMMISNPSALKLADGSWIMLYEQTSKTQPGQQKGPNGKSNQRNLYLATSADGITFAKQGIAIDSSKSDNFFASVPDMVLMPNNDVRLYYVCGGNAICSSISKDSGKTWVKEPGFRMANMAVDPDVVKQTVDGKTSWVMYYSVLEPSENNLFKAISTDGYLWTKLSGQVIKKTGENAIVDPDVFETTPGSWVMNFGESGGNSSTGGDQINLYRATFEGDIFAEK
ncbi:MAG: hypothetical protein WC227_02270 [Patescibacteria group bacterium]|jgi:hypothetical protein